MNRRSALLGAAALAAILLVGPILERPAAAQDEPAEKAPAKKKRKKTPPVDPKLPMVLILGDSISIGYTRPLREMFAGKANIIHNPGNSQGTTHTLANVDEWLAAQKWDVIHFNLGLHDLKRVKEAGTSQNSNDPNDPYQADLPTYTANLEKIVEKLKATQAKLVFATTTPFPAGVQPHRDPADAKKYNKAAAKIMAKHGVTVNDLYGFALPKLAEIQKPKNVHFKAEGSKQLAEEVAKHIKMALAKNP